MNLFLPPVSWLLRKGTSVLCRIDLPPQTQIPAHGPLIVVMNHINSLEVPLLLAHFQPRRMIGVAKVETWDNFLMGWLFDMWEAIPIRRGEPDVTAMRRSLEVLANGDILAVAPEGTRSYHGRLLRARPGVVTIALRSGAPILPVAHWGGEQLTGNLKHLKRTDFHVRAGRPFFLNAAGVKVTRQIRQEMVDQIMAQLAALLPVQYRGAYADLGTASGYLRFA